MSFKICWNWLFSAAPKKTRGRVVLRLLANKLGNTYKLMLSQTRYENVTPRRSVLGPVVTPSKSQAACGVRWFTRRVPLGEGAPRQRHY